MQPSNICPITLEQISVGGLICTGDIFEYGMIVDWFKKSDLNPLTNLPVGSKIVRQIDINMPEEKMDNLVKNTKLSYSLWFPYQHSINIIL